MMTLYEEIAEQIILRFEHYILNDYFHYRQHVDYKVIDDNMYVYGKRVQEFRKWLREKYHTTPKAVIADGYFYNVRTVKDNMIKWDNERAMQYLSKIL